jgi:hypothetical protein
VIIRNEQMQALARSAEQQWRQEFAERLRHDFPDRTSQMEADQLIEYVAQGFENAHEPEITEREYIYRFLKLGFLPKELLESEYIQSVLIRILNNLNVSGAKRLDFIEQHVTSRTVA